VIGTRLADCCGTFLRPLPNRLSQTDPHSAFSTHCGSANYEFISPQSK